MATPITMYKAADGQVFENLAAAVLHEQAAYYKDGLTPLMQRLLDGLPREHATGAMLAATSERLTDALAADKTLLADLHKLLEKRPAAAPTKAVVKKRSRPSRAKPGPGADVPQAPAPADYEPPAALPDADTLAALDSLGAQPIRIPEAPTGAVVPPAPPIMAGV